MFYDPKFPLNLMVLINTLSEDPANKKLTNKIIDRYNRYLENGGSSRSPGLSWLQDNPLIGMDILSMDMDPSKDVPVSFAYAEVCAGFHFTDPAIWAIADEEGCTVAHGMANKGYLFTDEELAAMPNTGYPNSVAEIMAIQGYIFDKESLLKMPPDEREAVMKASIIAGHRYTDRLLLTLPITDESAVKYSNIPTYENVASYQYLHDKHG